MENVNLLTAKLQVADSIILKVPVSDMLCNSLNLNKMKVDIGDCKLYCETEGEGIPMVLVHGGPGGTHHCFHPWLSGAKQNFELIYYDQRGCGQSDFNAGSGYSMEQTVDDLDELRKALNLDRWIVFGHSFGGAVAQYYTIKYPENVLGMVLVATVPVTLSKELESVNENCFLVPEEKQKIQVITKMTIEGKLNYAQYFFNDALNGGWKRQNFKKPTNERMSQLALYDIVFDPEYNSDYGLYDFKQIFDSCPIPVLICEGKYDSLWNAKKVPFLLKSFPGAQFEHFEYSSHNIYSDEPEKLIEEISKWSDNLQNPDSGLLHTWKTNSNQILNSRRLVYN